MHSGTPLAAPAQESVRLNFFSDRDKDLEQPGRSCATPLANFTSLRQQPYIPCRNLSSEFLGSTADMAGATGSGGKRKFAGSANKQAPRKKTKQEKRLVVADSLPWQTVDIPEMFDDAEGFYGLEEIKDVDVVRDGNTVKFVCGICPRQSITIHTLIVRYTACCSPFRRRRRFL